MRVVVVAIAAMLLQPLPSATQEPPGETAYRAMADRFARGRVDASAGELSTWPESRVKSAVTSLMAGHAAAQIVEAAAMLETDTAFRMTAHAQRFHLDAAQSLVRYLLGERARRSAGTDIDPEQAAAFSRRWFLAVGLSFLTAGDLDAATRYVSAGLAEFHSDASLSLADGMVQEALAVKGSDASLWARKYGRRHDLVLVYPEVEAERARLAVLFAADRAYRDALAVRLEGRLDPVVTEAHLRLGHVLMIRGDIDGARAELTAVLSESPSAREGYLAHLFMGRMLVDRDELDEAAREFEAARQTAPTGAAASIALGELADRRGHEDEAHKYIASVSTIEAEGSSADPWWSYPFDAGGQLQPTADWLQAAIRP